MFFTVAVSLSALLTLYRLFQLVFGGSPAKPAIPKAQTTTTRHRMEAVESSPPLPTVIYNFDPAEDLVALVAVDQSETMLAVEEDGKDAVIFIGNSALSRVIGAAKTLTAAHVTFISEDVAGTLRAMHYYSDQMPNKVNIQSGQIERHIWNAPKRTMGSPFARVYNRD